MPIFRAKSGKTNAATESYRKWLDDADTDPNNDHDSFIYHGDVIEYIRVHLWLGNEDIANQLLESLVHASSNKNKTLFYLENLSLLCQRFGLGPALSNLMITSPHADFLQPFTLALRAVESGQPPVGAAPEVLALTEEVLNKLRRG